MRLGGALDIINPEFWDIYLTDCDGSDKRCRLRDTPTEDDRGFAQVIL